VVSPLLLFFMWALKLTMSNFSKHENETRCYIARSWYALYYFLLQKIASGFLPDGCKHFGTDAWRRHFRKSWICETISLVFAVLPGSIVGISILSHNGIAAAVVSRVVHMRKTVEEGAWQRVASHRLASPRVVHKWHYNRREDFSSRSR